MNIFEASLATSVLALYTLLSNTFINVICMKINAGNFSFERISLSVLSAAVGLTVYYFVGSVRSSSPKRK